MALTQTGTSRTVRTRDWKLHYQEAGQGHPVVLLHGSGPGSSGWSNFAGNIEALSEHFHVYAVDMPGWGASDAVTVDELDHVETLVQFLDTLGIDEAAIVGNSMGGANALRMATEYPQRVSHVVTMGPPTPGPKLFSAGDGPSEGLKALIAAYQDPTPEAMRKLTEVMVYDKQFATLELSAARSEAAKAHPEHLENYLAGAPRGAPIPKWFRMDDLAEVTAPTLLIHGRDDRVVPYENSLALLARIPNSRLSLLNRCGHWAMVEHAEEFNRLVTDFVAHA